MKKGLLFLFALCSSILFLMCDSEEQTLKDEELKIQEKKSVDGIKLEDWVDINSKVLANYKREDIATYSRTVQKAILRSFSPEKRKDIWQSKVDYLITSSDFSKEEKKYLEWFAEKFKLYSYDKALDKDLSKEMYDKVMEGIKKFGWSNEKAYKMFFAIGNITDNQQDNVKLKLPPPGSNGTWCECYYDLGCPNWNCNSGANCGNTSDNPHDCGVFGDTACDGNC